MSHSLTLSLLPWDFIEESARCEVELAQAATADAVTLSRLRRRQDEIARALEHEMLAGEFLAGVQKAVNRALSGFAHPVRVDRPAFEGSRALASRAGKTAGWRATCEPELRQLLERCVAPGPLASLRGHVALLVSDLLRGGARHGDAAMSAGVLWSLYDSACSELAGHCGRNADRTATLRMERLAVDREVAGCVERLARVSSSMPSFGSF